MDSAYYEEDRHDGLSSRKALGRLLPLLAPYKKWLGICFLLLAASKAIYLIGPNLIRQAIDVDMSGGDYQGLLGTVGLYILVQGMFLIFNYIFRIRMEMIGQQAMTRLRKQLFDHIVKMAVSFFDRNPVGRLMARVESDTEAIRMLFTNTVVTMIGSVLLIAGMFVWMFVISPRLAAVVAVFIPGILVMLYLYHRITTPRWLIIRKRMADITAALTEFLQGMQIIQIFNRMREVRRRMYKVNYRKYRTELTAELYVVAMFNAIFFMETVIIALVLYVGARWSGAGNLSIGTLVMFISYIRMFMEPVHMAAEEIAVLQKAVAGAKRVFGLLDTGEMIHEPTRPVSWPRLDSGITFDNVSFSYTNDDNYALRDVSFTIPKGKRFALAGVTGGGKSTVINLLLRYYDIQKGRILVDGIDIRDITKEELRAKFGLVLQDIYLFPGNVATNVSLSANGFDPKRVVDACRTVSADRFIERMPDQYETELSERGANLSRGERQLLSFARALVAEPEVLILDEATSSVDPETERLIQEGMEKLMQGRTSIIIAHRLSTILNVDRILVVRDGEIIERGTHGELAAQGGYYSKLCKLQFAPPNGMGVKKAC
ncbi:MAG: ABC transporter ATP-binding protein [FCB group bacterium]|nr:ABC transporter ATP-binding protein [FCB group bacterium]